MRLRTDLRTGRRSAAGQAQTSAVAGAIAIALTIGLCAVTSTDRWQSRLPSMNSELLSGPPLHASAEATAHRNTLSSPPALPALPDLNQVPYVFFTFGTTAYFSMVSATMRTLAFVAARMLMGHMAPRV